MSQMVPNDIIKNEEDLSEFERSLTLNQPIINLPIHTDWTAKSLQGGEGIKQQKQLCVCFNQFVVRL